MSPAFDRLQPVNELVDEDPFLIFQRRHHAGAFDLHRLIEEDDDEGGDCKRNHQITQPYPDAGSDGC